MSRPMFEVVDPRDGAVRRAVPGHTPAEADALAEAARAGFPGWSALGFGARARVLSAVADGLASRADALAGQMADEMGKPVVEGRAEVEKSAWVCRFYAQHAESMLADEPVATAAQESVVVHRPLGPVLAVMPWNYPLWQVFRFAAPTLMAGNTALLKHAAQVPGCADAIGELFAQAGAPEGVFGVVQVGSDGVESLIAHPAVAAVTLTGSTGAGRAVAAAAGRHLKKVVLELGGSDPYLVLEDADLDLAIRACATSRLLNGGQSCIAAKRFLVHQAVYEPFVEGLVAAMGAARVGDPRDPATQVGPLARVDLRDALHDQVLRARAGGARCVLGGEPPDRPGAWYPPTVLVDVPEGNPAVEEELFGPVAAVQRCADEAELVRLANGSSFGLGAAVFTRDLARGRRLAVEQLDAGAVFVNDYVKSDPRLPFGGVKRSGYGRELGRDGILEFVNRKTVQLA